MSLSLRIGRIFDDHSRPITPGAISLEKQYENLHAIFGNSGKDTPSLNWLSPAYQHMTLATTPSMPMLPSLDRGVSLLETGERATGALQSLVLDHLLVTGGLAYWIDGYGHAVTSTLARIAPSTRLLDRIQIARGFTPFQHHRLLEQLDTCTTDPELVVLPAFESQYRGDDLARGDADRLLASAADQIRILTSQYEIPILLTRHQDGPLPERLKALVESRIHYETTRFGPRFVGEDFETLVYDVGEGLIQTTLTFWEQVLAARHETQEMATEEVLARGTN